MIRIFITVPELILALAVFGSILAAVLFSVIYALRKDLHSRAEPVTQAKLIRTETELRVAKERIQELLQKNADLRAVFEQIDIYDRREADKLYQANEYRQLRQGLARSAKLVDVEVKE